MKIYLLGFMAAGKTRLGMELAKLLDFTFIDLDQKIIEHEGLSVQDIFDQYGEEYFRKKEKDVLYQTVGYKNTIISTGGGTPCFYDNIDWINKNGLSIYLDVENKILSDRLWKGRHSRPLLNGLSKNDLSLFVEKKIDERKEFYQKSIINYKVLVEDQESAKELCKFLKPQF